MNNDSIALSERAQAACADMRRASHRLALVLVELVDEGHLRHLGYASLTEYASTVLDLTPREARAFYRLGTAFPTMPALAAAMEAGTLDWTKAREILRVVTPDTEAEWVARAQACTSRQLEREVSATPFGAPPPAEGAPIVPESQRGRLNLEGERSDIDTIRRAIAVQRAQCGLDAEEIDDCALLALLALASIRVAEQDAHLAQMASWAVPIRPAARCAAPATWAFPTSSTGPAPEPHEPQPHGTPEGPEPAEPPTTAPDAGAQGVAARVACSDDKHEPTVLSRTGEVLSHSHGGARCLPARWREPGERFRVVIDQGPDCGPRGRQQSPRRSRALRRLRPCTGESLGESEALAEDVRRVP